ncbi:unnamed protein product [Oreochromis niloticus]|nr:unnamed protein product [Mustela putorius furo]
MAEHSVIFYFSFLAVSLKGQTSVIKTQQTVLVEVRGNAFLNCQLMQFKDIVQVTWQKILAEGKRNLTSYHKTFGKKVNPDYLHKTEFKYAGLQNGSLVIKNVTEQDEGCYVCLFDVQHESPLRGKTCIQVYGKLKIAPVLQAETWECHGLPSFTHRGQFVHGRSGKEGVAILPWNTTKPLVQICG